MPHQDEQTLISPDIEKYHLSKCKYITVMDHQNQKEKDLDTRPHYRATTRGRDDRPSRRRTPSRSTHSRRTTQGGGRELVRLPLEDNQKMRETIIDLAKRHPQNSHNQDEIESFTSRSPGAHNRTHHDQTPAAQGEEGHRDNGHGHGKEPVHPENQGVRP